mgnify:CR=1 FL=1
MKLAPTMHVVPSDQPWFVTLSFSNFAWDDKFEKVRDYIKSIPGRQYVAATKCWQLPIEMVNRVSAFAQQLGYEVKRWIP